MKYIFVPYSYTIASGSLAGGAATQQPLILDADADFELHIIAGSSTNDAATDFRPNNFSVQVTDKNNSRIWANGRILQVMFNPYYALRRPVLLAKRSNLSFDFLNTTSATTLTATITFHGFKVFVSNAPDTAGLPA